MTALDTARTRAAAAYNAAADHFDHPANAFWDRFGRATVARLALRPGDRVLDVCCGSGASALPAAARVGPEGRVLGIDVAENLLRLARQKAARRGWANVEFQLGDLRSPPLPDESVDAVVCVFGIFFVPDMAAAVRGLWRKLRPGGTLAITTWGPRCFEPLDTVFWAAVQAHAPHLDKSFHPWDRISAPESLRVLLAEAGVEAAEITAQAGTHPLATPEDGWTLLLGSGYRGTIDALETGARERVHEDTTRLLRESAVTAVETNVLYARAVKSASSPARRGETR